MPYDPLSAGMTEDKPEQPTNVGVSGGVQGEILGQLLNAVGIRTLEQTGRDRAQTRDRVNEMRREGTDPFSVLSKDELSRYHTPEELKTIQAEVKSPAFQLRRDSINQLRGIQQGALMLREFDSPMYQKLVSGLTGMGGASPADPNAQLPQQSPADARQRSNEEMAAARIGEPPALTQILEGPQAAELQQRQLDTRAQGERLVQSEGFAKSERLDEQTFKAGESAKERAFQGGENQKQRDTQLRTAAVQGLSALGDSVLDEKGSPARPSRTISMIQSLLAGKDPGKQFDDLRIVAPGVQAADAKAGAGGGLKFTDWRTLITNVKDGAAERDKNLRAGKITPQDAQNQNLQDVNALLEWAAPASIAMSGGAIDEAAIDRTLAMVAPHARFSTESSGMMGGRKIAKGVNTLADLEKADPAAAAQRKGELQQYITGWFKDRYVGPGAAGVGPQAPQTAAEERAIARGRAGTPQAGPPAPQQAPAAGPARSPQAQAYIGQRSVRQGQEDETAVESLLKGNENRLPAERMTEAQAREIVAKRRRGEMR